MSFVIGLRWAAVSQSIRVGSQMLSLVLLSRMLPPHAYGLIGMAMTITNLAFMFRDMGTMITIVQRPNLTERLISTLFWLNLVLAAIVSLAMTALAAPLADFYHEPELTLMVCVLAASVFISSVGAVQQALMERQSEFRTIARIESINAAIGILTAIILAYKGYGVWSLVFQTVASTGAGAVQSWLISKWRPRFTFDLSELRKVLGFTSSYATFQFVSYLQKNIDVAFIGYFIGSVALGLYSMASKVIFFPLQNISGVATRVLVPAMCRRQHSLKDISELYERANAAVCLLLCPFLAVLFYLRIPIVDIVLGSRWQPITQILAWLVPTGFLQAISALAQSVLLALGQTKTLLKISIFNVITQAICISIGTKWGLQGAAIGLLANSLVVFLPTIVAVITTLGLRPKKLIEGYGRAVFASGAMITVLCTFDFAIKNHSFEYHEYVAVDILVGAASYGFTLLFIVKQDTSDLRALFRLR